MAATVIEISTAIAQTGQRWEVYRSAHDFSANAFFSRV
jgi:hypothetical protein